MATSSEGLRAMDFTELSSKRNSLFFLYRYVSSVRSKSTQTPVDVPAIIPPENDVTVSIEGDFN
jgi:hypothetical protein